MTIGSLFSGIGGLELGLESCGLGPVIWQCDSDPAARAVLEKHWPGVKRYNDVREIDESTRRPWVICGGFPCQPVSVAGARKAQKDTRWLWPFFAAVVDVLRPRVVFIENVRGLRSAGLRDVLADLAAMGFDAEWGCFSAAEVGAPHIRPRIFILAYSDSEVLREQSRRCGGAHGEGTGEPADDGTSRDDSDTDGEGKLQQGRRLGTEWGRTCDSHGWNPKPVLAGRDHGIPGRLDRERLLGNACVPAQAALAWRTLSARAMDSVGMTEPKGWE